MGEKSTGVNLVKSMGEKDGWKKSGWKLCTKYGWKIKGERSIGENFVWKSTGENFLKSMGENIVYCMGEESKWKSMDEKSMGEKSVGEKRWVKKYGWKKMGEKSMGENFVQSMGEK